MGWSLPLQLLILRGELAVKVKCSYCGIEFNKKPSEVARTKNHFCCVEHSNLFKQKRVKLKCEYCGIEYEVRPFEANRNFCSQQCANSASGKKMTGENHPNYKHGYSGKGKSYHRLRAFDIYEHKCACCGWSRDERILQVHHKDSNHENNKDENLVILCPNCHWSITLGLYQLVGNNLELV